MQVKPLKVLLSKMFQTNFLKTTGGFCFAKIKHCKEKMCALKVSKANTQKANQWFISVNISKSTTKQLLNERFRILLLLFIYLLLI